MPKSYLEHVKSRVFDYRRQLLAYERELDNKRAYYAGQKKAFEDEKDLRAKVCSVMLGLIADETRELERRKDALTTKLRDVSAEAFDLKIAGVEIEGNEEPDEEFWCWIEAYLRKKLGDRYEA